MNYLIISASPRRKGTSEMLAQYFADKLSGSDNKTEQVRLYSFLEDKSELLGKIKEADSIVLIGPCYVNTFPAEVLMLLEKMEETTGILHGQNLYGMIQGGMFYVHTHECAIDTLRNFADKNNVVFRGGFVMGGGAPLNGRPLEEVIGAKQTVPAVNAFIENIKENRNSPRDLYLKAAMKVPAFMAWILVTMMNRKLKKEFEAKGIDYRIK